MIFPITKKTSWIGPATLEDVPYLSDIHKKSFARAWSASEFQSLLGDDKVECLIVRRSNLRIKDKIIGFVLVRSLLDEAEILTIAVDPDQRKTGAAEQLMRQLMRNLYADRLHKLFLEVDETNQPALLLYQKLGFQKVGERKGYYTSGKDQPATALIMQLDLTA
ncbi:MAG: ribosomal protein S18-alanine N-acetyltransferase [Cohaesibacter sp.]|nr:ribosomal protein S18-alanine N-acetyltransferase [Cohaesibacter sp.]MCV6602509.1 ribosomal protein S18-alanine N-acetyltransferase [Cohaesibacter sp.]